VVKDHEPLYGAILAFGVKILPDAEEEAENRKVPIFKDTVIYHVIENYLDWFKTKKEKGLEQDYDELVKPAKIRVMEGYVFRRARPAIFGVEVLAGKVKPKTDLIRAEDGEDIGELEQIQDKGKALSEAEKGMEVAISVDKPIFGRHVFEGDVLYVKVPEAHASILQKSFMDRMTLDEQTALKEYLEIMRKKVPFWGA